MIVVDMFLDNIHGAIQEIANLNTGRVLCYDELGKALMGTDDDVVAVITGFRERGDFASLGPKTQAVFNEIAQVHIDHDTKSMDIMRMIGHLMFLDENKCKEDKETTLTYLKILVDLISRQQISDKNAYRLLLRAKDRTSNYEVVCAIQDLIADLPCATVRDLYNAATNLVYNTPEGRDQAQKIVQKMQNILDAEIDSLTTLTSEDIKRLNLESYDIIGVLHRIVEYVPPFTLNEQIQYIRNKYSEPSITVRVAKRLRKEQGLSDADTISPLGMTTEDSQWFAEQGFHPMRAPINLPRLHKVGDALTAPTLEEFNAPNLNEESKPYVPTSFHPARDVLETKMDIYPKLTR